MSWHATAFHEAGLTVGGRDNGLPVPRVCI